jgi:methionine sulfoxide reductase catalytic subunit
MSLPWNQPAREITPEAAVLSRRRWLIRLGLGAVGLTAAGAGVGGLLWWNGGADDDVLNAGKGGVPIDLFPAARNPAFLEADRPLTVETAAARYTNFYEFSTTKQVWRWVQPFQPTPWKVEVAGLVAKPRTFDIDDLLHTFAADLEERVYRHRCVEAWAMVVPWTGFPLAALLRRVEPLAEARYLRFTTFDRPTEASRQANRSEPWPYTEGLTLAEAGNELAFLAVGMYGHPLLKQHGAPVRLVLPWKYGFKSAKSVVRIELIADQPSTFWNTLGPNEYDFTANVNPTIRHPRWSQTTERMLGTGEVRPTQLYNGYGEWVARLYE